MLGPGKTFDSVEAARAALEKRYHDLGFGTVYVDIPEQEVVDGLVRLRVTEGKLARVRVMGARYFANRVILAQLPEARSGSVPNIPDLQRELVRLNEETPDRTVVPVCTRARRRGRSTWTSKYRTICPCTAASSSTMHAPSIRTRCASMRR